MYRKDLALNNLQWLICHQSLTQPNKNAEKIPIASLFNTIVSGTISMKKCAYIQAVLKKSDICRYVQGVSEKLI